MLRPKSLEAAPFGLALRLWGPHTEIALGGLRAKQGPVSPVA